MKTYSIGRDINCDIVINDSTDVISRRHALLNVTSSGKMTIIDQSSNGTYVNGIRISPNVPVPVTRKDIISLAHVTKLDWNLIPKSNVYMRYVLFALAGIIVIAGILFGVNAFIDSKADGNNVEEVNTVDSVALKKKQIALKDSLEKVAKRDSITRDSIKRVKARQDSIEKAKKARKAKPKIEKPKQEKQEKPVTPKQDIG